MQEGQRKFLKFVLLLRHLMRLAVSITPVLGLDALLPVTSLLTEKWDEDSSTSCGSLFHSLIDFSVRKRFLVGL